ncbi:hypothetical protein GCM10007939_12410 [Amylibacter marinus]|uniref:Uncharacterized protein n=1 Tax=Amylibacter marinus TaxID=1475483 RepID=A0ABQ5VU38_9RHOB|nr:hypothetical protein [Amylibacter marinus]GLQ34958.1 hypothetical protein GCM10007939_12410 [Amylibacter marinus]
MTAIKEFDRLEALGLWKEGPDAQRREVVVSFGDATLVLSDIHNRPLTHWSLAAIQRVESSKSGTLFSVDAEALETLEIEDPLMVSAIGKVRMAIEMSRPHPGRLRWLIGLLVVLAFGAFCFFWLPGGIARYAANILPEAKAVQIGDELLSYIEKNTGATCSNPAGQRALRRFEDRVLQDPSQRVHIAKMGSRPSVHLPGGNIVLNHTLLSQQDSPEVLAGFSLMEYAAAMQNASVIELFTSIGIGETLNFLGNGTISSPALERFADQRLFGALSRPKSEKLQGLFQQANIWPDAFAAQANFAGLSSEGITPQQILTDSDWVALVEICSS